MMTIEWRGMPVYVVNRTDEQLKNLKTLDADLKDPESKSADQPDYVHGEERAVKPHLGIYVGLCTHLGCAPKFRPEVAPADLGPEWLGGFFCPCHGSTYDLAGRVYKGVPASANLIIPPHKYVSEAEVIIGEDGGAA